MDWDIGTTDLIIDVLTSERIVRYGNGSCAADVTDVTGIVRS